MAYERENPGGGDRNGASNIVFLFGQNNQNNTLRPPRKQALTLEQRYELFAETRGVLLTMEHEGRYNVRRYLFQLLQRDMREVLQ